MTREYTDFPLSQWFELPTVNLPRPSDRRNCDTQQLSESVIWTKTVNYPGRATVETSTPNNTCWRCNNNERPTGINTTIEWEDGENWK